MSFNLLSIAIGRNINRAGMKTVYRLVCYAAQCVESGQNPNFEVTKFEKFICGFYSKLLFRNSIKIMVLLLTFKLVFSTLEVKRV